MYEVRLTNAVTKGRQRFIILLRGFPQNVHFSRDSHSQLVAVRLSKARLRACKYSNLCFCIEKEKKPNENRQQKTKLASISCFYFFHRKQKRFHANKNRIDRSLGVFFLFYFSFVFFLVLFAMKMHKTVNSEMKWKRTDKLNSIACIKCVLV